MTGFQRTVLIDSLPDLRRYKETHERVCYLDYTFEGNNAETKFHELAQYLDSLNLVSKDRRISNETIDRKWERRIVYESLSEDIAGVEAPEERPFVSGFVTIIPKRKRFEISHSAFISKKVLEGLEKIIGNKLNRLNETR